MDAPDQSFDRFVCTYVFDLLSESDIEALLAEARRVLRSGGRLCLVGLTPGERGFARLVSRLWHAIWLRWPQAVGGCRPLELLDHLPMSDWQIAYRARTIAWGITSQVVVGSPAAA